ncbi:MAG: endonuclease/exonuclease/phosphatase family protein [Candidatus Cloacimonetes bacterium]|jgi:endonuclease/exonuclease/phosphatase family metal-dependent hydrolase|nr:endonuclease/exonuclease/phosphatase family protein [Candidatus Cloacimonadota bacterium]
MKIVSWNIANYDDHPKWITRKNLIVDEIIKADPGIIALQEVRFNKDHPSTKATYMNTAEQILTQLQSRNKFMVAKILIQPAMHFKINGFWEGLSIISKNDIIETGAIFHSHIHNSVDINQRLTHYTVAVSDSFVFFLFNTHFSNEETNLRSNIGEMMSYTERFSEYPLVLLGDMNATPQNENIHKLTMQGFIDIWNKLNPDIDGFTYPSSAPAKRIDHCWANESFADKIKSIKLIGNKPNKDGIYPSDHLGLIIEV